MVLGRGHEVSESAPPQPPGQHTSSTLSPPRGMPEPTCPRSSPNCLHILLHDTTLQKLCSPTPSEPDAGLLTPLPTTPSCFALVLSPFLPKPLISRRRERRGRDNKQKGCGRSQDQLVKGESGEGTCTESCVSGQGQWHIQPQPSSPQMCEPQRRQSHAAPSAGWPASGTHPAQMPTVGERNRWQLEKGKGPALLPPTPGARKVAVACQSEEGPGLRSKKDLEGIWPGLAEEMK